MDMSAILAKAKARNEAAASRSSGATNFIRHTSMPVGNHEIRFFADTAGDNFMEMSSYWSKGHFLQRSLHDFPERVVDADILARWNAAITSPDWGDVFQGIPYNQFFFYAQVVSTDSPTDYFKEGAVYVLRDSYKISNAFDASLIQFAEQGFMAQLEASLDVKQAGNAFNVKKAKINGKWEYTVLPNLGTGSEIPAPELAEGVFGTLPDSLPAYDKAVAMDMVQQIEARLAEVKATNAAQAAATAATAPVTAQADALVAAQAAPAAAPAPVAAPVPAPAADAAIPATAAQPSAQAPIGTAAPAPAATQPAAVDDTPF
jgi:hypothetical protein